MMGNAMVGAEQYCAGQEYEVNTDTFRAIGSSCVLADRAPKRCRSRVPSKLHIIDRRIKDIKPKNILIIKTQGIGNVINITPTVRKMHELYPACRIDFMCDDTKKDMLAGWKIINKIYEYPADIDNVLAINYDLALVGAPGQGDDHLMRSFQAENILLPNQTALMEQHEVVVNIAPLVWIGWNGVDIPDTYIPLSAADKRKARRDFPGSKYIAICAGFFPSDQWARKNWGYARYARLIELLRRQYKDHDIVVMGIGADGNIFEHLRDRRRVISAVDKYTINECGAILTRCKFLVCNDTGMGHVAGAVGCKVFSIFGPTSITKNHPWRNSSAITLDLGCSPCQYTQRWATCTEWACLDIKPEEVLDHIKPGRREKIKHEIGVIMANHNRYSILLSCLTSLLRCRGIEHIRFILVDDNSDIKTRKLLDDFSRAQGNTEIIRHNFTYGRDRYHETIQQGLAAAHDCRHIMFMPDDGLYNPWLFEVVKNSIKYLTGQIKCITFWRDDRPSGRGSETDGEYNKYFDVLKYVDGFMLLFEREYLDGLEIHGRTMPGGSSIWWNIQLQMRSHNYKILGYKETLAEHLGNVDSAMHPTTRREMPIYAMGLNVWDKPRICE